jgi:hypothetical protein
MGSLRTCSYGLGFKNHVVKKVRVGSVADFAGLQLNDTLEMVNEVSVAGRPDEHVHTMIRQAAGDALFAISGPSQSANLCDLTTKYLQ